jgi:3-oxoacyl-[acyl-carrier protein] reductase
MLHSTAVQKNINNRQNLLVDCAIDLTTCDDNPHYCPTIIAVLDDPTAEVGTLDDIDFARKSVLVVGGSSGIGNAIAQGFRLRGADVHVWGTRQSASDYAAEQGCDLTGALFPGECQRFRCHRIVAASLPES